MLRRRSRTGELVVDKEKRSGIALGEARPRFHLDEDFLGHSLSPLFILHPFLCPRLWLLKAECLGQVGPGGPAEGAVVEGRAD